MKRFLIAVLMWILAGAGAASADEARMLMKNVLDREDGRTSIARVSLSTCRYTVEKKKIVCVERSRVKVMYSIRKDFGDHGKDRKTITLLEKPLSERGIGFLQYDYDEIGRDTDQWMYLSALGKAKRIIAGDENEPKTGTLFGSEIGYEDLEVPHLDDFTYTIAARKIYRDRACVIVEAIPTPRKAKKSNYRRELNWIDPERHIILKTVLFNRQGKKIKTIYFDRIERIDGIYVAMRMIVRNSLTRRRSIMTNERIAFNVPVTDDYLTPRILVDSAYQNRMLAQYGSALK